MTDRPNPPPPQLQLNYGSRAPAWRRRRPVIVGSAGLALVIAFWLCWPQISGIYLTWVYHREVRAWYALAQTWQDPPTKLKYTENPADIPPGGTFTNWYGQTGGGPQMGYKTSTPTAVDCLPAITRSGQRVMAYDWVTLFIHARTNADGLTRVIAVIPPHFDGPKLIVPIYQIGPNGKGEIVDLRASWAALNMAGICGPGEIRIFAGQADPADPARFFIPFEARGRTGHIDGVFAAGMTFSKNPADAHREALANADVTLTLHLDPAPATTQSSTAP